jgi:hypothetical protein
MICKKCGGTVYQKGVTYVDFGKVCHCANLEVIR